LTTCACPTCDRSRAIFAEAAANVAAGTTTAPTWAELEADDTTRVRLSSWARREQRLPERLRVDQHGYGNDGRYYAHLDGDI